MAQQQYELVLMLYPDTDDGARTELVTRVQDMVKKAGGTFDNTDEWGLRKLAYEIEHKTEAYYYLFTFSCDGDTLDEVVRVLRIADPVMRLMSVQKVKEPAKDAAAAGAAG